MDISTGKGIDSSVRIKAERYHAGFRGSVRLYSCDVRQVCKICAYWKYVPMIRILKRSKRPFAQVRQKNQIVRFEVKKAKKKDARRYTLNDVGL